MNCINLISPEQEYFLHCSSPLSRLSFFILEDLKYIPYYFFLISAQL